MILTDFVKQTFLRMGVVVTIPIRQNVGVESAQVIWNKELGIGEIKLYVKTLEKIETSDQPLPQKQDDSPKHTRYE